MNTKKARNLLSITLVVLYALLILSFPSSLYAQGGDDLKFKEILQDGIPLGQSLSILQDKQDFIWIGVEDGVKRFDGYEFVHYKPDLRNPDSIVGNHVRAGYEDKSGQLWFGTTEGLNKFDRETDTFTVYQHDPENPNSLSNSNVLTILEDSTGVLWVGTLGGGLNKFDRETNTFTAYQHDPGNPNSLSHNIVFAIYED
ncbi:MAG: histidine kinase, partial [Desulfobulbaceae bacterium]|nr:histidine kinase [Desulfobulbaceae bacterium]